MLNLITGGAGFIGTNLARTLLDQKERVIVIDNLSAAERWKTQIFAADPDYEFIEGDICSDLGSLLRNSRLLKASSKIERIYNLACPASPPRYMNLSLETIAANTIGMENVLKLAREHKSRLLQASTSEVYGDPEVHPQAEDYRGNVNTLGPRSCYDEGKRIAETICYEHNRLYKTDIRLVRIFNTYGPYMDPADGRVITNFIHQALAGEAITIYGEGKQTRSFQYVTDLISGFLKLMETDIGGIMPVNLGNPEEFTILELAEKVIKMTGSGSKLEFQPAWQDDPKQRKPDISRAQKLLNWKPVVKLDEGLAKTLEFYKTLQRS